MVNPAGTRAVSSDGATLKGWDARTGRQLWSVSSPSVVQDRLGSNLLITDDGKYVDQLWQSAFRVYDADTGSVVRSFWTRPTNKNGSKAWPVSAAARPGTSEFIVGEGLSYTVAIYDWRSGRFVATLGKHENGTWMDGRTRRWYKNSYVRAVAVSTDGGFAATAANDFGVRLWDLQRRRLVRFIKGPSGVVYDKVFFLNGGRTIAAKVYDSSLNKAYKTFGVLFRLWAAETLGSQQFADGLDRMSASADGRFFYVDGKVGESEGLQVFNGQGHLLRSLPDAPGFEAIAGPENTAFEMDDFLAAHSLDGKALWKTRSAMHASNVGLNGIVGGGDVDVLKGYTSDVLGIDFTSGAIEKRGKWLDDKGKDEEIWVRRRRRSSPVGCSSDLRRLSCRR